MENLNIDHAAPKSASLRPSVESIQSEVVRRICFREYPAGSQLKEAELAMEFGVSRTPVRDAISRIKHLGLVETRNGVGTVVIELDRSQIKHVYEMRLQLAMLIGTLSPKPITDEDKARAAALLKHSKALMADFSPKRYVELNHELHNLVADLIGNSLLRSFWHQSYFQAASTWYKIASRAEADSAAGLVLELEDLNTALSHEDTSAVGFVQRLHIGYGYDRINQHILSVEPEAN